MKKSDLPPVSVPRLNSLRHRLQKTPGPQDDPYLDQLMIFLDDPPDGITDRWKAGAEMCAAWNIATSGTSVWRLYRSFLIEWRVRTALNLDDAEVASTEELYKKAEHLIALRCCEMLFNPATPAAALVSLGRMNLRQKYLDLARQKHADTQRTVTERALAEFQVLCRKRKDPYAFYAFNELKAALDGKPMPPPLQSLNPTLFNMFSTVSTLASKA